MIHLLGMLMSLGCGMLTYLSFSIDPSGTFRGVTLFLITIAWMAVAYLGALYCIGWLKLATVPNSSYSWRAVVGWAVVFRLILLPSEPILETDHFRYLWDGYSLSLGVNPYQYSPKEVLDTWENEPGSGRLSLAMRKLHEGLRQEPQMQPILEHVNNKEVATVYPPFVQVLFGFCAWLAPGSIIVLRFMMLLFEGVLIASLILLLQHLSMPDAWVMAYAWSPLVLKEMANTVHLDGFAIALTGLAILLTVAGHSRRGALAWSGAVMSKYVPLLALPWFVRGWRRREWLLWGGGIAVLTLAFQGVGGRGLAVFAQRWESNGSIVIMLENLLETLGVPAWNHGPRLITLWGAGFDWDAFQAAKVLCLLALLGLMIRCWLRRPAVWRLSWSLRTTFWVLGAMLLLSPVCNPWYVVWATPFLCFMRSGGWLYFSLAVLLYYCFFIPEQPRYIGGIREVEYIPLFALLGWEMFKRRGWMLEPGEEDTNLNADSNL